VAAEDLGDVGGVDAIEDGMGDADG